MDSSNGRSERGTYQILHMRRKESQSYRTSHDEDKQSFGYQQLSLFGIIVRYQCARYSLKSDYNSDYILDQGNQ